MRALIVTTLALLLLGMTLPWWNGSRAAPTGVPCLAVGPCVTLDPTQASNLDEFRLLGALFEPLTRVDPATMQVMPALAERWISDATQQQWTFFLRQDARWSDGSAVTADQVVAGFGLHRQGASAALIAGMQHISAPTPDHITIEWSGPAPFVPALLATAVFVPARHPESSPSDWADPTRIIGNGPFIVSSHQPRHHDDLIPAPTYSGTHRARSRIRLLVVEDPSTAVRLYLDGRVDAVLRLNADTIGDLLRTQRPDLHSAAAWGTEIYRVRGDLNPRVRRALSLAVDRQLLARDLLRGNGLPATSLVPTSAVTLGYQPAVNAQGYDLTEARRLLAELPALPPTLEVLVPSNSAERVRIGEWLVDRWRRDLGIDIRLSTVPVQELLSRTKALQYDLSRGSLVGDYLDPGYFLDCFRADSGMNRTGWSNNAYQKLLDRAATANGEARATLLHDAEHLLLTSAPIIPLYHYRCSFLIAPTITGITANALELVDLALVSRVAE